MAQVMAVLACASLSACVGGPVEDGPPSGYVDVASVPDAVPRVEPRSRYGNPYSYTVHGKRYYTLQTSQGYRQRGIASWYGTKFHGRRTSSGEPYDMYAMTAAHKTLPLPTYARVTNLENGRSVVLRVNDRGPFHSNRVIDLSYTAAWKLGILAKGTGYVEVLALDPRNLQSTKVANATPGASAEPVRLYLQAGSFSVRANAEQMKWRMQSVSGGPVSIEPVEIGGRVTYRVRVGPIANVTKADRLVQQIADLGLETPRIIIE
ncbi:MAG: septal ring lytic transglycosylase RlpA family protein [Gammaproteobacteria bacterium]|nr:septal ring lytic transglycosylase RlpA family protein [Gammaproteobacteria bacterium]NIM73687.1 septal ring lytic transglycosylase RlpA family protein [Gammaproteobacteria bacterium]NIN37361.1 septal ring lytic transglycosylase RlpA family protein [Gammaproteobacteria bacterium]NIO25520.1 septal ring lytic transglycosylase RlpA family protein [Gammaproteobacteria bacterium]NIO66195.1 septal ring lytic transglycosylase RlpA family protein [Gammaproteobacteria bacterium]